jgi:acyl-CoA thioester hydrolase
MQTYIFELEMKVRDYECDLQGIVNNANYQHYMEHARHEFLETTGANFGKLHQAGLDAVIRHIEIDYLHSLTSGDRFAVRINIRQEGAKLVFLQDIYRLPDNLLCSRGRAENVCVQNGKLTRGEVFAELFGKYLKKTGLSMLLLFVGLSVAVPANAGKRDSAPQQQEMRQKKEKKKGKTEKENKQAKKDNKQQKIQFGNDVVEDENGILRNPDGTVVHEREPKFPKGNPGLWISQNLRYPRQALEKGISGKVVATCVIERDGTVGSVEIESSTHPVFNAEALRVIPSMPRWTPGIQRGKTVRVKYTVPVIFNIPTPPPPRDGTQGFLW